jgi:hypothetical protein
MREWCVVLVLLQVESKKASLREFAARMRIFYGQREWAEVFDPLWAIASYMSKHERKHPHGMHHQITCFAITAA